MGATCKFNYKYAPVFASRCRYIDLLGGRGRGGSHTGVDIFIHHITQKQYFRGLFLRQVLSDVRSSLFQDFKDHIELNESIDEGDFDINETTMTIVYKPTGNMIITKGVTKSGGRTAKLKSLSGITHVLIEEADELSKEDFDQLDFSLRTTRGGIIQIYRIYNPPNTEHWIWKEHYNLIDAEEKDYFGHLPAPGVTYFKPQPRTDRNILSIFSTYHDNIQNLDSTTLEKIAAVRESDPEYYYTVILGLVNEGAKGRIFSRWKKITDQVYKDVDARSLFGLDFGLARPAGIVEVKFHKSDCYVREHNYKPLTNMQIAMKMCELGVGTDYVIADSAEPNSIAKLNRGWEEDELVDVHHLIMENKKIKPIYAQMVEGFHVFPALKGPGSIKMGISAVKDLNVFYTEDSKNLNNEYINYKWALDKNKFPIDQPIDDFNHLMDPLRYCVAARVRFY